MGANDGITARVGRRAGRAVVSEVHRQAAGRGRRCRALGKTVISLCKAVR